MQKNNPSVPQDSKDSMRKPDTDVTKDDVKGIIDGANKKATAPDEENLVTA
jgi:hypothetical protein